MNILPGAAHSTVQPRVSASWEHSESPLGTCLGDEESAAYDVDHDTLTYRTLNVSGSVGNVDFAVQKRIANIILFDTAKQASSPFSPIVTITHRSNT